ncbi:MAG: flagellar export protein FliJ [Treponema sp.]|jgi:flagellar FliJ protein|nr:flagellar export protein FliJ [Treponema sp.]
MRAFKFPLEQVLKLREYRQRETEIALGRAVAELTDLESRMRELALLRLNAQDQRCPPSGALEGERAASLSGGYYRNYEFYIQRLDREKEELLEAAAKAQLKVEEARSLYLEASRERKVLDKLKEKQAGAYRKAMIAADTKTLDDLSSARAGLNKTARE